MTFCKIIQDLHKFSENNTGSTNFAENQEERKVDTREYNHDESVRLQQEPEIEEIEKKSNKDKPVRKTEPTVPQQNAQILENMKNIQNRVMDINPDPRKFLRSRNEANGQLNYLIAKYIFKCQHQEEWYLSNELRQKLSNAAGGGNEVQNTPNQEKQQVIDVDAQQEFPERNQYHMNHYSGTTPQQKPPQPSPPPQRMMNNSPPPLKYQPPQQPSMERMLKTQNMPQMMQQQPHHLPSLPNLGFNTEIARMQQPPNAQQLYQYMGMNHGRPPMFPPQRHHPSQPQQPSQPHLPSLNQFAQQLNPQQQISLGNHMQFKNLLTNQQDRMRANQLYNMGNIQMGRQGSPPPGYNIMYQPQNPMNQQNPRPNNYPPYYR